MPADEKAHSIDMEDPIIKRKSLAMAPDRIVSHINYPPLDNGLTTKVVFWAKVYIEVL